jgi:hypothetical protein
MLYAILKDISVTSAAQKLNRILTAKYQNKFYLKMKKFHDNVRSRRLIPHQTDVNKFFRLLSEKEMQFIFGNLLMALNSEIRQRIIGSGNMCFIADNTKYAYYGKDRSAYELGTTHLPGTHFSHQFQAHAIHAAGSTLFTDFFLLQKGIYRAKPIPMSVEYLIHNGFRLTYSLFDREFYRAPLIKKLKNLHMPVITPAKKYFRVRMAIKDFLLKKDKPVQKYLFSQTAKVYPFQSSVQLWLVVVGHDNISPYKIREDFWANRLSYDEAISQLAAFFTTSTPWQNMKNWISWLTRSYKKRWNIETAFRELNFIHNNFQNRHPTVHLGQLYLRALIYNQWQYFRKKCHRTKLKVWEKTLTEFNFSLNSVIEHQIETSVCQNLGYLIKQKRGLYFQN